MKKERRRGIRIKNDTWRRLLENKLALAGLIVISVIILMAIFADVISDYDLVIKQHISIRLQFPSSEHWFGTDEYGRDMFARIIFGARISLSIGVVSVALAIFCGCVLGGIAGYYGGIIDNIIMRIVDIVLSIPPILFCIAIVAALGPGIVNLLIALIVASVPGYTRIVRACVLTVKDQEFIEAARAIGIRNKRIISKHVLLNCMGPILVNATMGISGMILTAAGLSFIGLGVQPPSPEWGAMLSGGRQYLMADPYLLFFPGAAIVVSVLSINFIGDGLRDALDPKLKD